MVFKTFKAFQVSDVHVYGNFRPLFPEPAKQQRARDRRAGMSPAHLVRIRQLQCTVCYATAPSCIIDAHHLKSGPARCERGIGLKCTDRWCTPLCRTHHNEIENLGSRRELGWFEDYGIEPYWLAQALWRASSDRNEERSLSDMRSVLHRHKLQAIRTMADRDRALRKGALR